MQVEHRQVNVNARAGHARRDDAVDDRIQELLGAEGEEYNYRPVEEFDEMFDKEEAEASFQAVLEQMARDSGNKGT